MTDKKHWHGTLSSTVHQASKLYGNCHKFARIREQDIVKVNFEYDYPMIYLDFLDLITGEPILKLLHEKKFPNNIVKPIINPESNEMQILKTKIDERFYPLIFMIIDYLGQIDQSITAQYKGTFKESI